MSTLIVTYTSISSDYEEPSDAEDQPLPDGALPAALSSGYVADSDLEEDLEEDLANYPADGGDNDDDESSDDDDDDDDDVEEDEEKEHLAPVDSFIVPIVDPIPSAKDTEAFETDESAPTHYASKPTPLSPPPSLLTPLSSLLPHILSPLLPVSSPPLPLPSPPNVDSPTYAEAPLGYKASRVRLRAASPSTHHPSEIPSPPLLLPSTTHRDDLPKADMPLRNRARFTAPTGRFEVGESSSAAAAARTMIVVGVDDRALLGAQVSLLIRERRYFCSMASSYEREAVIALQKMPPKRTAATTTPMIDAQIKALIAQGVADTLVERDVDRSKNGNDSHDSGSDRRRRMPVTREFIYTDFLKCQPLNFKGNKGVVGLTQWFENMESVFHISNCTVACQIKFATCTLQGTVEHDVSYAMAWKTLKKMMTDKYCPRGEIKKLEIELWNLKVKGTDVESYSQRFQELALMCSGMFPEESDEVKKYVGGLPDMIQGSVMASKPKNMQDVIEFATELMDQKIRTLAEHQAENKRKFEDTSRNNQNQQHPFKRHNVARAYTTGHGEKKPYG
ncbi:putative reverse transcriptase domain-containing protein [Tanacetum coccineum]